VILNLNASPIEVLLPKNGLAVFDDKKVLLPFCDDIIITLSQLGLFLMKEGRREPSVVAAGYWLRKHQLMAIKSQYSEKVSLSKGVAFHIAPGNVDSLFFYSMVVSVLCGNQTILRISNKLSDETLFFIELIERFFINNKQFSAVRSLMNIVQYQHTHSSGDKITQQLSIFADVRVIWGGDNAVKQISEIPLKEHGCNVTFPDRYSVGIIQLKHEAQLDRAVNDLLADIKPFYQQACSSPKIIYWLKTAQKLQDKFWLLLSRKLNEQITLAPTDLISQLVYLQRLPLLANEKSKTPVSLTKYGVIQRVDSQLITIDMIKSHCGLWVLLNQQINELDEIKLFEHCQTVTVSGVDENRWLPWQKTTHPPMKRIVSAGQALSFSHVWDGVDMIKCLTNFS
jgi:hypothetical protein